MYLILAAAFLLVVGGNRGCNEDVINATTLIDLTAIGGSLECANPGNPTTCLLCLIWLLMSYGVLGEILLTAPYPMPIKGAASGVVNSLVTVCGGLSSRGNNPIDVISDCYQMNAATNTWSKTSDMPQNKAYTGTPQIVYKVTGYSVAL